MKKNFFYSLTAVLLIVICIAVLGVVYVMPKLTAIDPQDESVVQLALAQTPLAKAERVEWFTGGQVEQTIVGRDALGRSMYVIVTPGQQLLTVYASSITSPASAEATYRQGNPTAQGIVSLALGELHTPFAPPSLSWQIVSRLSHGQFAYTYLSAHGNRELWNFTTSDTFRLWDQ